MTQKEIKAAESLLQSYQRHTDRRDMVEYYTGKINGLTELLTDCGYVVTQDAAGIYMVMAAGGMRKVKGYKAFDADWKCRGFQYEVGKTYKHSGPVEICKAGFHFCENPADCWDYYKWDGEKKFAEIEAVDPIGDDSGKFVTGEITIVAEIPTNKMLEICNFGKNNTGTQNTGNRNAGNRNTGNWNTGDWNTGCKNTGNWNAGDWNTGDWNTGNQNAGDWNTGYWNTGDWNTGNRNTGNRNTGDWNAGDCSYGCFCEEEEPRIRMFDKQSSWTMKDWRSSDQAAILSSVRPPIIWVETAFMTDEEKEEHPEHTTIGGYMRRRTAEEIKRDNQEWWDELSDSERDCIKALPNFDTAKFCRIMGGIEL